MPGPKLKSLSPALRELREMVEAHRRDHEDALMGKMQQYMPVLLALSSVCMPKRDQVLDLLVQHQLVQQNRWGIGVNKFDSEVIEIMRLGGYTERYPNELSRLRGKTRSNRFKDSAYQAGVEKIVTEVLSLRQHAKRMGVL